MKIEMKFQYLLVKDKILLSCIFNTQKLKISEIFYYKNILSKPYILIKKQFLIKINFQKYIIWYFKFIQKNNELFLLKEYLHPIIFMY